MTRLAPRCGLIAPTTGYSRSKAAGFENGLKTKMARKLKRARWSYAEDRRLLELAASSKSVEEVAHLMRRSPAGVYKMTVRLGAPLSPIKLGLKAKK
jgi:hypothetical protein